MNNVIRKLLMTYEPRIKVKTVDSAPDYDNNGYEIEVEYYIVGRDDDLIVAEVFLERTR